MKIRYANTRWDLTRGQWYMLLRNRALLWIIIPSGVLLAFLAFFNPLVREWPLASKLFNAGLTVALALGAGVIGGMVVIALNVILMKNNGVLGEHTLELTDEGLVERTEYNVSLQRWAAVSKTRRSRSFYFIFITEQSAHIIPERRLLEGNLEEFVNAIDRKAKNL